MVALLRYHISHYIKSSKFVMPLLTFFLYLAITFTTGPKTIVSSMILSAIVLYVLMVWAGFVYSDCENPISEQLLMLKCNNMNKYYISKMLFLLTFGAFMSVIGMIVPAGCSIFYSIVGSKLFTDAGGFCFANVIQFFLIYLVFAFLGAMVGYFFQPRVFKNKILAIVITFLFAIMGFVQKPLTQDLPILKVVTWIFPPVYSLFADGENVAGNVIKAGTFIVDMIIISAYATALSIGSVYLSRKKGF